MLMHFQLMMIKNLAAVPVALPNLEKLYCHGCPQSTFKFSNNLNPEALCHVNTGGTAPLQVFSCQVHNVLTF